MTKAKIVKEPEPEAPKPALPDLLKKRSMFSGGSSFGAKGPTVKFTPKTFRVTQHRGG